MAYIQRCEVRGLAARISRQITLNSDVNILFGGNGSGKTSLLKVLHSALDNDVSELKRVSIKSATVTVADAILEGDLPWYEPAVVTRTTPDDLHTRPLKVQLSAHLPTSRHRARDTKWISESDRQLPTQAFRHIFLPTSRLYFHPEMSDPQTPEFGYRRNVTEDYLDKQFAETINLLWLRYTRNIGIEVQAAQARGIKEILYDFLLSDYELGREHLTFPVSDPSLAYERLLSFLGRQSDFDKDRLDPKSFLERLSNEPRMAKVLSDVERVEERVEAIRKPGNELRRLFSQMIADGKQITFQDKDVRALGRENEKIDLEDLSSGEKQLLRIFVDVLFANGEPIIIDEPELSLHIDWQRRLVRSLKRLAPQSQLIVATHSPEIMAEVDDENIIEL